MLCKQAGRPFQHYLSSCSYLPEDDWKLMTRVRQTLYTEHSYTPEEEEEDYLEEEDEVTYTASHMPTSRRACTKQSPVFKSFYKHFPLQQTLDTGAEISMIKSSVANFI